MPKRILAITAGLAVAGLLGGALAAGIGLALFSILRGDFGLLFLPDGWIVAGLVGGAIGFVVAPVVSWLFLRHVPLGRLIAQTTVGTALAGGIGFALALNPFICAGVGFLGTAAHLAWRSPRGRRGYDLSRRR
jgi:hypothetical protein